MSSPEHFIPISKTDLLQQLVCCDGLSALDRQQFLELSDVMDWRLHREFHEHLATLKSNYAAFDPDSDHGRAPAAAEPLPESAVALVQQFARLLEQANYIRLDRADIQGALETASDWGINLRIDFDAFEQLEVFQRGEFVGRRLRRNWHTWYRRETVDVPTYRRLAVVFQLQSGHHLEKGLQRSGIFVKLFKNIPKADLEMVLPGTQVRMNWLDHGKILFPTLSGIGLTIWKVLQGTLMLVFSGIQGTLAFLACLGGTVGYGVKSVFGYLNTKNKYQLNVTRNLYYQNLDNNLGVLFRIMDEAEEQEFRETILAYFLLWRDAPIDGWTTEELDEAVEGCLGRLLKVQVNFEIADAIRKLQRFELAVPTPPDRWRAVGISDAIQRLRSSLAVERRGELHSPHFKPPVRTSTE